jgi:putative ABC transport system substrate-binding protein
LPEHAATAPPTIRRREFVGLVGGAAAWPLAARAQQRERMRRIGVLMGLAAGDPETPARLAAFAQGLQQSGWTIGRNVRVDYRFGAGDPDLYRQYAAELIALMPDVVLATAALSVEILRQQTRTVPIVFTGTIDPVGGGLVASLARPGGNITGFTGLEYGNSGKWLELLKEIAPGVTRVAVLRNPTIAGSGQFGAIQAIAPLLGIELLPLDPGNAGDVERLITTFAQKANGGVIVTQSAPAIFNRNSIIAVAVRHRLPAVYPSRLFAAAGGLISFGAVAIEDYRRAAGYVDRILRGEKPADLPVQAPVKYETVLNLKTAKALGLDVPAQVLVRADEVIE